MQTDKEILESTIERFNKFQNEIAVDRKEKKWDIKMEVRKFKNSTGTEKWSELRIHNKGVMMYKYILNNHKTDLLYRVAVMSFMDYATNWLYQHAKERAEQHDKNKI